MNDNLSICVNYSPPSLHFLAYNQADQLVKILAMFNNAVIANKVREAILLNPEVSAQDILVTCSEGEVTLAGDVDTPKAQLEAERTATGVEGVVSVRNCLFVRSGRWPPPAEAETLPRSGE